MCNDRYMDLPETQTTEEHEEHKFCDVLKSTMTSTPLPFMFNDLSVSWDTETTRVGGKTICSGTQWVEPDIPRDTCNRSPALADATKDSIVVSTETLYLCHHRTRLVQDTSWGSSERYVSVRVWLVLLFQLFNLRPQIRKLLQTGVTFWASLVRRNNVGQKLGDTDDWQTCDHWRTHKVQGQWTHCHGGEFWRVQGTLLRWTRRHLFPYDESL
jgi:hypothetical protein